MIKYDNEQFVMKSNCNINELVDCFVGLLDAIEKDDMYELAFALAKRYRMERDAENNSDN